MASLTSTSTGGFNPDWHIAQLVNDYVGLSVTGEGSPEVDGNEFIVIPSVEDLGDLAKEHDWEYVSAEGTESLPNGTESLPTEGNGIARKTMAAGANTIAGVIYKLGVPAAIVKHGLGYHFYAKLMEPLGALGSNKVVQYIIGNTASAAAGKIVETPIIAGISVGAAANVAGAVAVAGTVYTTGAIVYNTIVAKTEADKIPLNPVTPLIVWIRG